MIDGNTRPKAKPLELSPVQERILMLLAQGYCNTDIGEELGMSAKSVESHRVRLMERFRALNIVQCFAIALKRGLLNLDELDVEP